MKYISINLNDDEDNKKIENYIMLILLKILNSFYLKKEYY